MIGDVGASDSTLGFSKLLKAHGVHYSIDGVTSLLLDAFLEVSERQALFQKEVVKNEVNLIVETIRKNRPSAPLEGLDLGLIYQA